MGLLDLFKRNDAIPPDVKPLEEYLKQRSGGVLFSGALEITHPYILTDIDWGLSLNEYPIAGELDVDIRTGKFDREYHHSFQEPIPKCYQKKYIKAVTLLEMALEKGVELAAFYLAVFHEHGIGVDRNQSIANQYYAQALNGSGTCQIFTKAMEYQKQHMRFRRDCTSDQVEELAINIFNNVTLFNPKHEDSAAMGAILGGPGAIEKFGDLGTLLLCSQAGLKKPYSMCVLGSLMVHGYDDRKEDWKARAFSRHYSEKEVVKCGVAILEKCEAMAREGNEFARNVMKAFDYSY